MYKSSFNIAFAIVAAAAAGAPAFADDDRVELPPIPSATAPHQLDRSKQQTLASVELVPIADAQAPHRALITDQAQTEYAQSAVTIGR